MIQILNAIYGGERFVGDGVDRVIDLGSHLPGFCLDHTGKLKASNAEISGHIEALSGFFENVRIGKSAVFEGTVNSGPLFASNETLTPPEGRTWPVQTYLKTIKDNLGIGSTGVDETKIVNFSGGSYGSKTGLTQLQFSMKKVGQYGTWVGNYHVLVPIYANVLKIIFSDNAVYTIEGTNGSGTTANDGRITQILTVGSGASGKILQFNDLPVGDSNIKPNYPEGTIYKDPNGYLRIT